MAVTFLHLDADSGNDTNSGADWANALETFQGGVDVLGSTHPTDSVAFLLKKEYDGSL
ncbi:MAG: hypothetical protein M5R36_11420 [Deltaproteobacteria bacterium]|nr:hypothetical protein [Deltaproteobacteria bacterium]